MVQFIVQRHPQITLENLKEVLVIDASYIVQTVPYICYIYVFAVTLFISKDFCELVIKLYIVSQLCCYRKRYIRGKQIA